MPEPTRAPDPTLMGEVSSKRLQTADDRGQFAQWFQSEGTQVAMKGMFNALSSIGAGLAGMSPGLTDTSSLGPATQRAAQGFNIAQRQWNTSEFVNYIDDQITEEEAKPNPDKDRLMTYQILKSNPEELPKYVLNQDNWRERMEAGFEIYGRKVDAKVSALTDAATDYFNRAVDPEKAAKIRTGDLKELRNLMLIDPIFRDHFQYMVGPGGVLENIPRLVEKEKGTGGFKEWVASVAAFFTGDDEEDEGTKDITTAKTPKTPKKGARPRAATQGGRGADALISAIAAVPGAVASGAGSVGSGALNQSSKALERGQGIGEAYGVSSQLYRDFFEQLGRRVTGR